MKVRKACLEISMKKFLKRKVEAEQARAMIVCEVFVFDFEEALTSFKFKNLIKFSSLLMWIKLPRVFYQTTTS